MLQAPTASYFNGNFYLGFLLILVLLFGDLLQQWTYSGSNTLNVHCGPAGSSRCSPCKGAGSVRGQGAGS